MERDTASGNGFGIQASFGGRAVVLNSTIVDNVTGVDAANGGELVSRLSNTLTDNTTDGAFTSTIPPAFRG